MKSREQEINLIREVIEFGDYYLIKVLYARSPLCYDGQVVGINEDSLVIECWNVVKGNLSEIEINFSDIEEIWALDEMVWG